MPAVSRTGPGPAGSLRAPSRQEYTGAARAAIQAAAIAEHDFARWLAGVLAAVAAGLGSSDALTARRPGSWESSRVDQLVKGTVGSDDEYLSNYRAGAP